MTFTLEHYAGPDALSKADLARATEIVNACWAEWIPGEPPLTTDAYRDDDSFTHPPEVVERRLARDGAGELVGVARIEWRTTEAGHSNARVFIAPEARRQGVGTALGAALVEAARLAGRTGVTFEAAEGSVADGILERAGLRADLMVEQNRADVGVATDELLQAWVAAGEAAEGYSLVGYDSPCADDRLLDDFVAVRHIMNDAPRYEGEGEWTFTPEELRATEVAAADTHIDWWNLGVRHDATGELIGLSDMYLPRTRPWIVFQGDTAVAPTHRGHGLGAWMKAVNHLRLRRERPEVQVVQTWNASVNAPMLRINRALGFQPVLRFRGWYLPLS